MMMNRTSTIAVLGAGAWGTALAVLLAGNGHTVRVWEYDREQVRRLAAERVNTRYLPGVTFPDNLQVFPEISDALSGVSHTLIVVPSHAFRSLLRSVKPHLAQPAGLAWATKGLGARGELLHRVVREEVGEEVTMAVMSGPSFAKEVSEKMPTAVTIAATSRVFAEDWRDCFCNAYFQADISDDL